MMIAGAAGSDEDDDDQDIHQDTQRPILRSRLKADVGDDSCDPMPASAPLKGDAVKAEGSLSGKARGKTGKRDDVSRELPRELPRDVPRDLPGAPGKANKARKGRGKAPSVREASPPGIELGQGHEEWLLQGSYVEVNWGSDWWQATAKRIKALGNFVCVCVCVRERERESVRVCVFVL